MTWHLKDRELEKKLIEIAPDFVESLNESLKLGEYEENSWTYRVWFGPYEDCYKFEMHVYDDELEEVPEYNPKAWNDSRKVNPPNDVVFRAEIHQISISGHKWVNYQCLIYKDNKWFFFRDGRDAERVFLEDVEYIMFRPWEN